MAAESPALRILVVGAGIGGLAAATRLAQNGLDIFVYERRPNLVDENLESLELNRGGRKVYL
jgi:flavin-dependent dehydrogenase